METLKLTKEQKMALNIEEISKEMNRLNRHNDMVIERQNALEKDLQRLNLEIQLVRNQNSRNNG